MFTKIKNKFGFTKTITTKQIDKDIQITYNSELGNIGFLKNVDEREFHIKLRRDYLKDDGILLDGTIIDNYKGRYKLNKFIKK